MLVELGIIAVAAADSVALIGWLEGASGFGLSERVRLALFLGNSAVTVSLEEWQPIMQITSVVSDPYGLNELLAGPASNIFQIKSYLCLNILRRLSQRGSEMLSNKEIELCDHTTAVSQ